MPARLIRKPLGDKTVETYDSVKALTYETEKAVVFGKTHTMRRRTFAFRLKTYRGPGYRYAGGARHHHRADEVLEMLAERANGILADLGIEQEVNTGIVTHYPGKLPGKSPTDSKNGLGFHSDSSPNLKKGSAIVAFTFGEARPIYLKDNKTREVAAIAPEHGDAYVMLPGSQEDETHRVPNGHEERWSVTFRTLV